MSKQNLIRPMSWGSLIFLLTACYQPSNRTEIPPTTPSSPSQNIDISPSPSPSYTPSPTALDISFFCGSGYDAQGKKGLPTTFVRKPDGSKTKLVIWETEFFTRSGYPPQVRCEEVSPRFDGAYQSGGLNNYLTATKMDNQDVICTAKTLSSGCDQLLITLRPGDNSKAILEHLSNLLNGHESGPIRHAGGNQQYYKIDIEKFLSKAEFEKE